MKKKILVDGKEIEVEVDESGNPIETNNPPKTEDDEDFSDQSSEDLVKKLRATRAEAKKYRLERNDLRVQVDQFNAEKSNKEEEELKAKGEHEKIITNLKTENDQLKTKATLYDEYKAQQFESAKAKLGEDWLDEYGNLSLASLNKLVSTIEKRKAEIEEVDNGTGITGKKIILTEAEKDRAREMFPGMDDKKAFEFFAEIKSTKKEK